MNPPSAPQPAVIDPSGGGGALARRDDRWQIRVRGLMVKIGSPRESLDLGIGTVYQHVLLVPSLTVIENLMLGRSWWRPLDRAPVLARFQELSEMLGVAIDPEAPVGRLSLGQQQQVEIMRALWRGEGVLILDEPTSMLTPQGARDLTEVMKRLRDKGVAVIFITHKLREAYAAGDRVSVLRLGRLVGSLDKARLSAMSEEQATDAVIRLMFGTGEGHAGDAEILLGGRHLRRSTAAAATGQATIALREVSTAAVQGECALQGVTFEVRAGEILGIAGVDGMGRSIWRRCWPASGRLPAARSCWRAATSRRTAWSSGASTGCATSPMSGWGRGPWARSRSPPIWC